MNIKNIYQITNSIQPRLNKYGAAIFFCLCFFYTSLSIATPTFLEAFKQHNSVMLLINPKSGQISQANSAAAEFYGYTISQLESMTIQQINTLTPDQVLAERELAVKEGRNFFIFRHRIADQSIKTVEVYSVPLTFDGTVLLYSIINDISKKRDLENDLWHYQTSLEEMVDLQTRKITHANQFSIYILSGSLFVLIVLLVILMMFLNYIYKAKTKAQTAEQELRLAAAVFKTASEGMIITNAESKIINVNDAFSQITGFSSQEVMGLSPELLKSGHHTAEFYANMYQKLGSDGRWEGEIYNKRKNGEIFPEWLVISAIYDHNQVLEGYVGLFNDISAQKQDQEQIWHQANFDSLTGLANRNLFLDRFSSAIKRAERNKNHVALLFIDLDRFKAVNDTLGHLVGDLLLQEVSSRIKENQRKSDTISRLGGDEFAVIVPEINDLHNIENLVNKLLESLAEPYRLNGNEAFISASIGITLFPDDGKTTQTLLRNADSAMYKAKHKGRNDYHFFTSAMDKEAHRRRTLEKSLYQAVENNEFSIHYQPIIDLNTDKIVSCEALVRWSHPKKGMISPNEFIPLAEDTGIIVAIGEWVLRESCLVATKWLKQFGSTAPAISVNVSSFQFKRKNIPDLVAQVLNETGLPADKLTLEITESLLVNDDDNTLEQLKTIRQLGVSLSIDDFGTGYSSLSYLKKFPITTLKIDRSFIMGIPENTEDKALVEAIISMALSLNLKIVAEGVETLDQSIYLKTQHCTHVQGFLYSKPLPFNEFNQLIT